jgi:CRP/FNR family transcriptional regulator
MVASAPVAATDPETRATIAASSLRGLSPAARDALFRLATVTAGPAGAVVHREGERRAHLELVVSGLVRVFVVGTDGRSLTVRYARAGALIGAASLFAPTFVLPATIQAVVASRVVAFSPDIVRRVTDRDPLVARARSPS